MSHQTTKKELDRVMRPWLIALESAMHSCKLHSLSVAAELPNSGAQPPQSLQPRHLQDGNCVHHDSERQSATADALLLWQRSWEFAFSAAFATTAQCHPAYRLQGWFAAMKRACAALALLATLTLAGCSTARQERTSVELWPIPQSYRVPPELRHAVPLRE